MLWKNDIMTGMDDDRNDDIALLRSRGLWVGQAWPNQISLATGKCSHVGHPVAAALLRIPGARSQFHCTQIPAKNKPKISFKSFLHGLKPTFLHARTIFFKSYSELSPCTVVRVLRPFRCWILIWTSPSWTSSSAPLLASANGSEALKKALLEQKNYIFSKEKDKTPFWL